MDSLHERKQPCNSGWVLSAPDGAAVLLPLASASGIVASRRPLSPRRGRHSSSEQRRVAPCRGLETQTGITFHPLAAGGKQSATPSGVEKAPRNGCTPRSGSLRTGLHGGHPACMKSVATEKLCEERRGAGIGGAQRVLFDDPDRSS